MFTSAPASGATNRKRNARIRIITSEERGGGLPSRPTSRDRLALSPHARLLDPRVLQPGRRGRAVVHRVQLNQLESEPQVIAARAVGAEHLFGHLADRAAVLARSA